MTKLEARPQNIICLATYFKGADFIHECKSRGCHVVLVTKEKMLGEDWPRESLDDLIALPNDAEPDLFIYLASFLGREQRIDRVVALEEFDVVTAALIREHLGLPGMTSSVARLFRDKVAMSQKARAVGVTTPEFVPLLNHPQVREFLERVPSPWVLKPRSDVSAIGIRKVDEPAQVWQAIEEMDRRERLRERSPHYFLGQFVSGAVFHVDALVRNGQVIFVGANQYGRPPLRVAHGGGTYISRAIAHGSEDERTLFDLNRRLVEAFGLKDGATHAEFIKSDTDGCFYFLEIAARVGGAYIAEVLEAATGINLWREWAKIELADDGQVSPLRKEYAGIVLSLARQEFPDTTAYNDPEIVFRVRKKHHAGLIVRSPNLERVTTLLDHYAQRFKEDFLAIVPPLERAE